MILSLSRQSSSFILAGNDIKSKQWWKSRFFWITFNPFVLISQMKCLWNKFVYTAFEIIIFDQNARAESNTLVQ